jgi:nucleoside-diphosphate kinase
LFPGLIGPIIDSILDQGFLISAIDTVTLDKIAAEEFLEVYKGVVPEYSGMVDTITAGQVCVLDALSKREWCCLNFVCV